MSGRPSWDLTPCGTPAAYRRHYRLDEKPCAACRRAESLRNSMRDRSAEYEAKRERYVIARQAGLSAPAAKVLARSRRRFELVMAGAS